MFYMIKRILESKDAVISTLAVTNAPVDPLSQEEWNVLQEACTVLEPFEQVTVEISAERYSVQMLSHYTYYTLLLYYYLLSSLLLVVVVKLLV